MERISIIWFVALSLFAVFFLFYKLLLKGYRPSLSIVHLVILTSMVLLILRCSSFPRGWEFIGIRETFLKYIDLVGIPLLISIGILLFREMRKLLENTSNKETLKAPFIADDPIETEDDDKLEYAKRAKEIIAYLERSHFKKSFTIGIVGPWGNGKSSLIELIEKKLRERLLEHTLHMKFLPFLNHSESEIISEFFNQLSASINPYSGRLSNQIIGYSDKLLKLYKTRNIKEFLSMKGVSDMGATTYDTYQRINDTLKDLNKRFIVFIDDLDRLSNKEVLQVLKLVRNTANFTNFIFIIALDKDYVLESLIINNDISDHAFVDKFFQLEVYLPEIEKSKLKNDFVDFLKTSGLQTTETFIQEAERAIYRKDNLFDDYISNHRGVKRLVNQLVFDHNALPDQLDTNDFLNFTYLKMAFPFAIKFLNKNWSRVIPYNPETKLCELEVADNDKDQNQNNVMVTIRNSRLYFGYGDFIPDYAKYKISASLTVEKELGKLNNLNHHQNLLLAKTLIVLFGKENQAEKHTSIKFGNNLRKLLQQKIVENELTSEQFEQIFDLGDSFKALRKALEIGQAQNILDRISFHNSEKVDELNNVILVLLYIFNSAEEFDIHPPTVLQILSELITRFRKLSEKGPEAKATWEAINKQFLEGDFKTERKLEFLVFLSENRIRMNFDSWGTDEATLKELSLELYESLLGQNDQVLWDIYDYSFYHSYQNAKKFNSDEELNPMTKKFWENNDIELLCAQMTQSEAWTTKVFRTSDFAKQLFGSKGVYRTFVENRASRTSSEALKQYVDFLRLESHTGFMEPVRYEFDKFELVRKKTKRIAQANNMASDEFEHVIEVFIEAIDESFHRIAQTNVATDVVPGFISFRNHHSEDGYYSSLRINSSHFNESVSGLLKHYERMLNQSGNAGQSKVEIEGMAIVQEGKQVIKIVSVQPKSYLSKSLKEESIEEK
ncbi:MAG: P-loop NTPase fold protein [Allomuricauda sp.]